MNRVRWCCSVPSNSLQSIGRYVRSLRLWRGSYPICMMFNMSIYACEVLARLLLRSLARSSHPVHLLRGPRRVYKSSVVRRSWASLLVRVVWKTSASSVVSGGSVAVDRVLDICCRAVSIATSCDSMEKSSRGSSPTCSFSCRKSPRSLAVTPTSATTLAAIDSGSISTTCKTEIRQCWSIDWSYV